MAQREKRTRNQNVLTREESLDLLRKLIKQHFLAEDKKGVEFLRQIYMAIYLDHIKWPPSAPSTIEQIRRPISEGTRLNTGKRDRYGNMLCSGDYIKNTDGLVMMIHFGTYQMYCPGDDCYMDNVGFYVTCDKVDMPMPLGPTEEYAKKLEI